MNILFVVGYDLERSPWATRPRAILQEILAHGHPVTVVALDEAERSREPIHPPLPESVRHIRLRQRYVTALDAPLAMSAARRKILPYLRKADVVHIQKPKLLTWAIGRRAVREGKPIIYDWDDLEGSGGIRSGWSGWKVDRIEAFFVRHSKAIVVASRGLERFIEERYPEHPPLHSGPCGVDPARFNPEIISDERKSEWRRRLGLSDEKVIVYHGQLEMGEPGTLLLEALEDLREAHKVKLLLVGGGKVQQGIIEKARALGLEDHLLATGYVPFNEVPALLALADLAVALIPDNPYGRCKSPLKIYEAMAMGLPLVASKVGQAAEVLQACGVLIPPGDRRSLAEALLRLLDNPHEARQLGAAARRRAVERHSWKALGEILLQLYEESVNPKGTLGVGTSVP